MISELKKIKFLITKRHRKGLVILAFYWDQFKSINMKSELLIFDGRNITEKAHYLIGK